MPTKNKNKKEHWHSGDVIQRFYDDLRLDRVTEDYIPKSDLAYITSLVNTKFGTRYSFQQVQALLKEVLGAAI